MAWLAAKACASSGSSTRARFSFLGGEGRAKRKGGEPDCEDLRDERRDSGLFR